MVFLISMENHASPFVLKAEQKLEHGPFVRCAYCQEVLQELEHGCCKYNEKSGSVYSE